MLLLYLLITIKVFKFKQRYEYSVIQMELTVDQALQKGIEAHKAGKLQEADQYYAAILQSQPKHPDANHNMGILAVGVGKVKEALPFFKIALEANPSIAQFWLSYIDTLIKLEKLVDAKAILDQAKSNGAKGDGFDQLDKRLREAGEKPLADGKTGLEETPQLPNVLNSLKLDQAIKLATKKSKEGSPEEAKRIYQDILAKFPKNKKAIEGLKRLSERSLGKAPSVQDPPQKKQQSLIKLYSQGQLEQVLERAKILLQQFPNSIFLHNMCGIIYQKYGELEFSIEAYTKAITIKPDYAEAYYNMGLALKAHGKLDEAIKAYNKALTIKSDYAEAYNDLGVALKGQGKMEEAITAFHKALNIKNDFSEAHINLGNALQDQNRPEEAVLAFRKALSIQPKSAEFHLSVGVAYSRQGKLAEAIKAYENAVYFRPNYALAHLYLSALIRYVKGNPQIELVKNLLTCDEIPDKDKSCLHYAYAKMNEDLGKFSVSLENYIAGGKLRKEILAYDPSQDFRSFSKIKAAAPQLMRCAFSKSAKPLDHTPIFILGMPRSGTTLVEQIISSHSQVYGAGELNFLGPVGASIIHGNVRANAKNLLEIRNFYLSQLKKVSCKIQFVTDKMPHNFRMIGLIISALPEAKIIHTKREPAATCWANFKQYFHLDGLGYSYDIGDTVRFFNLYRDLMDFWDKIYDNCVYHLDYDELTINQVSETKKVIKYLGLNWEEACLSPHENNQGVKTASQHQVRKKVYWGSSQAWKKYEPFLNGVFDQFKN